MARSKRNRYKRSTKTAGRSDSCEAKETSFDLSSSSTVVSEAVVSVPDRRPGSDPDGDAIVAPQTSDGQTSRVPISGQQADDTDTDFSAEVEPTTPDAPADDERLPSPHPQDPDSRLDTILELLRHVDQRLDVSLPRTGHSDQADAAPLANRGETDIAMDTEIRRLTEELHTWRSAHEQVQAAHDDLLKQNEELASRVAQSSVQRAVETDQGCDESLSWEQRKMLILQQMEEDTFDAAVFVDSLSEIAGSERIADTDARSGETFPAVSLQTSIAEDPVGWVHELVEELQSSGAMLRSRDEEIAELKILLQDQSATRSGDTAVGAAAIADLVDSDELVRQERDRLQELKTQWEEKFRQAEVAASLERAKLSRERQELARRGEELEEKLEQLQREQRIAQRYSNGPGKEGEPTPRRWLAELGLGGSS